MISFFNGLLYDALYSNNDSFSYDVFDLITDGSKINKIEDISLVEKNEKNATIFEAVAHIRTFILQSQKEDELAKMLAVYCELNHLSKDMIEEVRKELLQMLPSEIVYFPPLKSIYGKYINSTQTIAITSEYRTKMDIVFIILHELCNFKRDAEGNFDVNARTQKNMLNEAGNYNEQQIFGVPISTLLYFLKNKGFYYFVEDLKNWKIRFIRNFIETHREQLRSEGFDEISSATKYIENSGKINGCNIAAAIQYFSKEEKQKYGSLIRDY